MVLESTVICVDNSEYMRNGDFLPTRIQAQQDAVNLVCRAKARLNPENSVGLMTLASLEVLVTLTTDVGKVLSTLHSVKPKGAINIITGIKIAHLALKHRQSKNHRMRIVAFVASPLVNDEKELVKLAKRLKKEKVNVDIVNFGEEDTNTANLETFIKTVNGKDGTSSHLVTVASGSGPILADALVSSAIIDGGEEGSAPASSDGLFDPANDPELALALRVSLEEERQRQEEGNKNTDAQGTAPSEEIPDSEEALLQQALRMSGAVSDTSVGSTPFPDDVSMMSEADQIEYAIKMSLQQHDTASDAETPNIDSSRETTPMNTDITNMEADNQDFSEEMADPEFLRNVLGSLPNVDPDSEAVKAAIGQTTQQSSSKSDSKKKDEPMDEDSEKK